MIGLTQGIDAYILREIGEHVHALCSRGSFGHALKTEIEGILFPAYARNQYRLKRPTGNFRWFPSDGPQPRWAGCNC